MAAALPCENTKAGGRAVAPGLDSIKFFFKGMDRLRAEGLLSQKSQEGFDGCYLVRSSESQKDCVTLSIGHGGKVSHVRIVVDSRTGAFSMGGTGARKPFPTLHRLLRHLDESGVLPTPLNFPIIVDSNEDSTPAVEPLLYLLGAATHTGAEIDKLRANEDDDDAPSAGTSTYGDGDVDAAYERQPAFDATEWPQLAAVIERSAARAPQQHRYGAAVKGADGADVDAPAGSPSTHPASARLLSSWPPTEGGAPPSLESTVRAVAGEAAALRATRSDDPGVRRAVEAADRAEASVGGIGAGAAEPGRDVAAAVLSLQGVDWEERVETAMGKIDAQGAEFEKQLRHLREHGALPPKVREVALEQLLDAVGALAATAQVLLPQAESEFKLNEGLLDSTADRLRSELRKLPRAVKAVQQWGLEVPRRLLDVGESELFSMPLAATDPDAVDGAQGGETVQRVIGALVVAGGPAALKQVAWVDFDDKGDVAFEKRRWVGITITRPPRKALNAPGCANLATALRVYSERAAVATATLVPKVLSDVAAYANAKAEAISRPDAKTALDEIDMLSGNGLKHGGLERAMELVNESDADAPPPTTLEHAVHKQQRAVAGSKRLYRLVSEVVRGVDGHELVVLPGGVKRLARTVFKSAVNYGCDLSRITDQVRCTVVVSTLGGVALALRGLMECETVLVVRVKNRFEGKYDAAPAGGYVDLQTMVVFESDGGGWVMGEVQINLWSMLRIKENPEGGHKIFNFARAIRAYDRATFVHKSGFDDGVAARIAAGVLLVVDLQMGDTIGESTPAVAALCTALATDECRVWKLELYGNKMGDSGVLALAEALKLITSVSELNLSSNAIGDWGAAALADALKSNTSVSTLHLDRNKIGPAGASMLADALKHNTSLFNLTLYFCEIGDGGTVALANGLKHNTSVSSLNLGRNFIGDSGAAALADALKVNTSITTLNLIMNEIGNSGVAALADALKVNTSISTLLLSANDFDHVGVAALADFLSSGRVPGFV